MDYTPRQIEIIEAVTKLIGEKGIQNLTTKNLAAEIGFSEPALYRHYKGKIEILESVLQYYKEILVHGMSQIIDSNYSAIEKIHSIIKFQFNHFSESPAVIMIIFAETSFQYDNVLSKAVAEIMTEKRTLMGKIIQTGQGEGSVRNDISYDQLTSVIMGSMRFMLLKWRLSNFNFNLRAEGKNLFQTIELLIKKSPK
ncbi:MAG: TetR/AcrR family transcriptional regulator [Cytophagales bacterium]|nr:TetR/AcrR family transcriptional regulator [Cytophagales bacterium]